jgi:hypothetical protein
MSGYRDCREHQISGQVSGERPREDEAGRVAISANKGEPKREPGSSLMNIFGHSFPLEVEQSHHSIVWRSERSLRRKSLPRSSPESTPTVDQFEVLPPDKPGPAVPHTVTGLPVR